MKEEKIDEGLFAAAESFSGVAKEVEKLYVQLKESFTENLRLREEILVLNTRLFSIGAQLIDSKFKKEQIQEMCDGLNFDLPPRDKKED